MMQVERDECGARDEGVGIETLKALAREIRQACPGAHVTVHYCEDAASYVRVRYQERASPGTAVVPLRQTRYIETREQWRQLAEELAVAA